jgi:iron complex outermembrane receptor protein
LFTIKGNLYNTETGELISMANIAILNSTTGTSSDELGNFELLVTGGIYKIRITSVGFARKELEIRVPSDINQVLRIGLQPKKQEIESVDVFGNFVLAGRDTSINRTLLSVLPAITKINAFEIEKQGALTLTDAMKYVPGGWTETRGRKSKQFFSVRGQKYPYPDYSIDGIWQKEFEETAYFLSVLNIESVEIIRSSNALVKGLSGLTGVIEVKTKKPEHENISLLTKYGENNHYVANLQYGNKINDVTFNTTISLFGTNGIPDRRGKERISNFHGNMDWVINKNLSLSLGATSISGLREFVSIVEPGSSNIMNREESFDPLKTLITYARLNHKGKNGVQTELQTNFAYRNGKYINYNISQNSTSTHWDNDWEYGLNVLHSRPVGKNNNLRLGALYNHWEAPDGKRYYAGRRCNLHTWSGVIADEQKIGRFLLDAGFRLIGGYIIEWGGFGIEGSASGFQKVAPIKDQAAPVEWQSAFGASYIASRSSSVHYNFSGGTIAPRKGSLDENGLMPQNEMRFQHDLGFKTKSLSRNEITASAFYTQRNNAINLSGETLTTEDDLIVELYENKDKISYGIELATKIDISAGHSFMFANATFMKSKKEENDKMTDDDQLPNVILNAGLFFEHAGFDVNIFVNYIGPYSNNRFVSSDWVAENGDFPLGDFVSADITAGFTFSGKFSKRIFVEIKNILDKKYQTVAGYPDVGRLFNAGIKINLQTK